jgi:hypothetical protein
MRGGGCAPLSYSLTFTICCAITTVFAVEGDITGVKVLLDSFPRGGGVSWALLLLPLQFMPEGFIGRTLVGVKSGRGGPADI